MALETGPAVNSTENATDSADSSSIRGELEPMFDITCSVDHTPNGVPAGRVLARVRDAQDWLAAYESSYPQCVLTAVPIDAFADTAHGGVIATAPYVKPRHRVTIFDHPTIVTEPRPLGSLRS